tara:strand:+ start:16540 stop:17133 length:594 start_codon:yes stop_codon:yes gene_type:complete
MALLKAGRGGGGGNKYMGICPIGIVSFQDKSDEYKWADIYLDVTIKQEDSDYTKSIQLAGSLDRDPAGDVIDCSVVRKVNVFFDGIGETAGINIQGEWESEDGEIIPDITEYLNEKYAKAEPEFNLLAYVFKGALKKGQEKPYVRVYHKVMLNTPANKTKLEEDIAWRKSKGYIKEYDPTTSADGDTELAGAGLYNL